MEERKSTFLTAVEHREKEAHSLFTAHYWYRSCLRELLFLNKVLDFGCFVNGVIIGVGFSVFRMMSSADLMSRFRCSKFYWKVGYNTSL